MAIKYIDFMPGVSVSVGTRAITAINGYSADKHGGEIDAEASGNGVHLYLKRDGKRTGERIYLPSSSIATIRETVDNSQPKAKS